MSEQHLWEVDHPYYCAEGNYYASGRSLYDVHSEYGSWTDFLADWGDSDLDMNLVFRWDWKRDNVEEGEDPEPDRLYVYWVLQRKAILRSTECIVTEADEPAVREWLTERATHMAALWAPLPLTPAEQVSEP